MHPVFLRVNQKETLGPVLTKCNKYSEMRCRKRLVLNYLLKRTTNLLLEKIELGQPNRVEHLLAQRLRKNLLVVNNQETSSHSREFLPSNQVKVKVNKAYLVKQ